MKAFRAIFILVFVSGIFSSFQGLSQKKAEKVLTQVTLFDDYNKPYTFVGEGIEVYTGSGNFLRTVNVKVSNEFLENKTFEPYANIWTVAIFYIDSNGDGFDDDKVVDSKAFLNKSGHLSVTFHYNGAGSVLPKQY
jgi:hypothetical protein